MTSNEKAGGTERENAPYPLHAIQLLDVRVTELRLTANLSVDKTQAAGTFNLGTGHGAYDNEKKRIQVKVSVSVGADDPGAPFSLLVEVVGMFAVDEGRFPVKHIEHWAQRNAPLVLYPYVREHVYGLAVRAGFPTITLPLLEVPTFRLMPSADGEMQVVTTRNDGSTADKS
jgi:preprotein translocase subunit SecB